MPWKSPYSGSGARVSRRGDIKAALEAAVAVGERVTAAEAAKRTGLPLAMVAKHLAARADWRNVGTRKLGLYLRVRADP